MKKQKSNNITKEDLVEILDQKLQENQKSLLASIDKKFEVNQEEMAVMVNTALQSTQDLILGEIGSLKGDMGTLKGEAGSLRKEMRSGFEQVTEKINNLSRNTVDVIHQEEFDKLEDRVVVVEEVLDLKLKKA